MNNYHHAHDAYLNIVVGNTYRVKFTVNPLNFVKEAKKNPNSDENRYNMDRIFDWNVRRNGEVAWLAQTKEKPGTIQIVKRYLGKNSPLMTKMAHEKYGELTRKITIWSAQTAKDGNTSSYIPVKMHDPRLADVTKYGGLTSVSVAGYTLIDYKVDGKRIRSLEALPVYLGKVDSLNEEQLINYFGDVLQRENNKKKISEIRICKKMIPRGSLIKYNGFYYYLAERSVNQIALTNAVQLCLSEKYMQYVKKIEKACATEFYEEKTKDRKLVISRIENENLYNILLEKSKNTIFKNKTGAFGKILENGKSQFISLSIEEQCKVLMQVVEYFRLGGNVDLRLIGGSKNSGASKINKKISGAEEVLLISQSVTGIFSSEIDLLKI